MPYRRAVVVLLSMMMLGAACTPTGGQGGDKESDSSTPTPSADRSTTTPSARPSKTSGPSSTPTREPAAKGSELWSVELPNEATSDFSVARSAGTYVVTTDDRVLGLSGKGKKRWQFTPTKSATAPSWDALDLTVRVAGNVVVIAYRHPTDDRWPRPKVIKALDGRTGKILWYDKKSSFVTTFRNTVYTTRCNGKQDGRRGNCMLAARRPHSGKPRWTAPTQASAQVRTTPDRETAHSLTAPQEPRFLRLDVFPHGYEDQTTRTLDPKSAQYFRAAIRGHTKTARATDTLINGGRHDDDSSDGCSQQVTGLDLHTGRPRWKHTVRTVADGKSCQGYLGDVRAGDLASVKPATKRPMLLDLTTGKPHWKARRKGTIIWANRRHVLTVDAHDGPYRMIDHRSGEQVWKVAASKFSTCPMAQTSVDVVSASLRVYAQDLTSRRDPRCATRIFDVKTAKPRYRVPGSPAGAGKNWIATATEKNSNSQRAIIRAFARP